MKKTFIFSLIISLLLPLSSLSAQTSDLALATEIDKLLQEHYKSDGPGAAVLVARKGQILYHKSFGMANIELGVPLRTDHVFRIGSITKQFTAAAILQLM